MLFETKVFVALAGLMGSLTVTGAAVAARDAPVEVVRVVDGDTIVVRRADDDVRVRLLNVDAPESVAPGRPVDCLGPEAAALLERLLPPGTEVELVHDRVRHDRFDRELAGVFHDGELVNAAIARAGLGRAVHYGDNLRFYDEVRRAAAEAQRAGAGVHAADLACSTAPAVEALAVAVGEAAPPSAGSTDAAYSAAAASLDAAATESLSLRRALWASAHRWPAAARGDTSGLLARLDRVDDSIRAAREELVRAREQEVRRRAAEREAARRAEAERVRAEAERVRAEAAAAEREREAAARQEQRAAEERDRSSGSDDDGGYGGGPPGYTGCREYAPGGRTWKPIPCPGQ